MEKKEEIKILLGNVIGEMLNSDMECISGLDEKVRNMIIKNKKDYITLAVDTIDEVIENRLADFVAVIEDGYIDEADLDDLFYGNVFSIFPFDLFEFMISESMESDDCLYSAFSDCIVDLVNIHMEEDK